jgi:ABC-type nitrate/sulfonate/bicarbonate transport system permease component
LTLVRWAQTRLPRLSARLPVPAILLWGSLLGLLAVLEAATRSGSVRRSILVPPSEVGATLIAILATGRIPSPYLARTGESSVWAHLGTTGLAVGASFGLGVLVGTMLGVILWGVPWLERAVRPYLLIYYALPVVALYPVLILLFSIGPAPIITLGFLFSLGAITVNTCLGLREVERSVYVKVGRSLGLGPLALARHIYLPAAGPYIFAGWRLGFTYSIIGVIASEFITSSRGIGYAIKRTYDNFETANMYGLIAVIIFITAAVMAFLDGVEARVNRTGWVPSAGRRELGLGRPTVGWLLIPTLVFGLWQLGAVRLGSTFVPGIPETVERLLMGLADGTLSRHSLVTLQALGLGTAWAVGLGLFTGFLVGTVPVVRLAYARALQALYSVPKVTLYPIFLFVFGLGLESKVAFGAFHGLFPVAIYTWTGILTIKPVYFKVARSLRLNRMQLFFRVIVPAVAPAIFTGIRLGFNVTFLGVILGEMFASRAGLGFLLMAYGGNFDLGRIFVVILAVFGLALGLNALLFLAERLLLAGRQSAG